MRCPSCRSENADAAKFCGECGTRLAAAAPPAPAPVGERRIVTVLFADLVGFTAMSETLPPDELRDLMDGWFRRVGAIVPAHGGIIDKFIGDAVMALFGAPVAHEDDPERAIDAALEMQAALAEYNQVVAPRVGRALAIRVGINTGRVFAGHVGGAGGGAYTVLGDAVNVASRLEAACPVGEVLISDATLRHVRGLYDTRATEPLRLKGKSEPLAAHVVVKKRGGTRRSTMMGARRASDLVGRQGELGQLREAFQKALADGPALVRLVGAPGLGKRRLCRELAAELETAGLIVRALAVRCRTHGARSYQVLGDSLRAHLGLAPDEDGEAAAARAEAGLRAALPGSGVVAGDVDVNVDVDETLRLLLGAMDLTSAALGRPAAADDPRALSHATCAAAASFFAALARRAPLYWIIEDLHEAPAWTGDLLAHLAAGEHLPLLVVGTARAAAPSDDARAGGPPALLELELEPLGAADARTLAERLLARAGAPAQLVDVVLARAGGNPFYMEELAAALALGGAAGDADAVPDTIGKLVQAHLDRLAPATRITVQKAAAAGERFWTSLLVAMDPDAATAADVETALEEAAGADLVELADAMTEAGEEIWRFRHVLARDAVYEAVVVRERRAWHGRLAEHVRRTSPDAVELAAWHLARADQPLAAAERFAVAGDAAAARYATRDARARYQEALDALEAAGAPGAALASTVHEKLGDVCLLSDYAGAEKAFAAALALAPAGATSAARRARLLARQGRAAELGRDRPRARAFYEAARDALGDGAPPTDEHARVAATVQQLLGWNHWLAGELDAADAAYRTGLAVLGDRAAPAERAALENGVGVLAEGRGDLVAAAAAHRRALAHRLAAGVRAEVAPSYMNLGVALYGQGLWAEARAAFAEAGAIHAQTGNLEGIGIAAVNLGCVALDEGDLDGAGAGFDNALGIARRTRAWWISECLRAAAELALRRGDHARAAALIDEGLAATGGVAYLRGTLLVARGALAAAGGRFADADADFREASAILGAQHAGLELAVAHARHGEALAASAAAAGDPAARAAARTALAEAETRFARLGNAPWLGRVRAALAAVS